MEKLKGYFITGLGVAFLGMCSTVYGMESVLKDNTSSSSFTVKEGTSNSTLFMVRGDGNVGIGTTAPGAILDILDAAGTGVRIKSGSAGMHTRYALGRTTDEGYLTVAAVGGNFLSGSSPGDLILTSGQSNRLLLGTDSITAQGTPRMTIVNGSGNVGIGTTAPSSKLEVSGGDIRVTSGSFIDDGTTLSVPDYVFDTKYILKPIAQVKAYIQKHKHLEGLPDTNDRKGWSDLSMQDRDMKLLEKIEELTLYVIQLKEENDALKQRVKVLENVKLAANK